MKRQPVIVIGERFRVTQSLLAIRQSHARPGCVTITENSVVTIEALHDADRIVKVKWRDEELLVIIQDFRDRSGTRDGKKRYAETLHGLRLMRRTDPGFAETGVRFSS